MRKNKNQNNSEYGDFSCSALSIFIPLFCEKFFFFPASFWFYSKQIFSMQIIRLNNEAVLVGHSLKILSFAYFESILILPILWEKYEYQFPRFTRYDVFCCILVHYEKLMEKPIHFPYHEVYHRMGI